MLMDMRFFYTFFPTFGGETFVFFCLSPSGECYAFGSRCLKCFVFQNGIRVYSNCFAKTTTSLACLACRFP